MEEQGSIASPTPEKLCTGPCGRTLPVTKEFFYGCFRLDRNNKWEWGSKCKKCHNATKKKKKVLQSSQDVASMANGHKQKVMSNLQETESVIIHRCDSCGVARGNILGDIDRETHKRYGQLCARCTDFMRISKGDPTYVNSFLTYLQRTRVDIHT